MSNAIYKKDLHDVALAVAQGSKNYIDKQVKKAKDELITLFSKNTVETDDHTNELTYQITAPSGAKLLQLQAVGGNSVKYAPSVTSDDSVAKDKVIPEYTYDAQLNYIGGASKVSENLFDNANTTLVNSTFNASNQTLFSYGGFALKVFNLTIGQTYTITSTKTMLLGETNDLTNSGTVSNGTSYTFTATTTYLLITNQVANEYEDMFANIMLNYGSTALPYQPYFDNIRSAKTTSVKFEGANLADLQDVAQTTTTGVTYKCENGAVTMGANATNNTRVFIPLKTPLPAGTYSYNQFTKLNGHNAYLSDDNNATNIQLLLSSGTTNPTATITTTRTMNYLYYYTPNGSQYNSYTFTPMIVRGSTAPTEYKPYIAPITRVIPSEIQALEDYGLGLDDTTYNYVDLINKKFIQKVHKIVVDENTGYTYISSSYRGATIRTTAPYKAPTTSFKCIWYGNDNIANINYESGGHLYITFTNAYASDTELKNAMLGVVIEYELATPIETDISQYIDDDFKKFALDNNYTNAELINEYNYDIPNKLEYYGTIQETLCPSVSVDGINLANTALFEIGAINTTDGSDTVNSERTRSNYIEVSPSTSYSVKWDNANVNVFEYDSNKTYIRKGVYGSFSTSATTKYIRFYSGLITENTKIMLNKGNTALDYRPYKHIVRNLPTITSDGYGVNANAHNLRVFSDYEGNAVNKRYTNVNKDTLGNYNYTYESSWGAGADFYINSVDTPTMKKPSDNDTTANVMTNSYTNVSRNTMYNNATDMVMSLLTGGAFKFRNNLYDDATVFKTAMANEPLYFELADASKTETDTDDFDFFFDVEEGDVITFNNPYAQQVYATYSFIIKEAKSNE